MRVSIKDLTATEILAGAESGRRLFAKLVEQSGHEPSGPEALYLDFQGVEVATASFLRESVVAFRDTVRKRRSNFYPVIANANDAIADELEVLVGSQGDVLMLCDLKKNGQTGRSRLAGDLDPKQRITFDLVQSRGETDASELMRNCGTDERVKQTAWNNRLSSLVNLGLVMELSQGRAKRYRALFQGK